MAKIKFPEIMYDEGSQVPFIKIDKDGEMNDLLFVAELKETEETETQENGNELPVFDYILHQYFNANVAKEKLDPETFDKVRIAFNLEPLHSAIEKGKKIYEKVKDNIEQISNSTKPTGNA